MRLTSFIKLILCSFILFQIPSIFAQQEVDVIIIGGGTGGTAAGIQASRLGAKVLLIEETPWLGGMLSSAGVSAIDGNHQLPSGIWGEFRSAIYSHYDGDKNVATGWVSHTLFEPKVANTILQKMAKNSNLTIALKSTFLNLKKENERWKVSYKQGTKEFIAKAKILIDGTETGTLLPLVDAKYHVGMDAKTTTLEKQAPKKANSIIQDMTYVAILEDMGKIRSKKGLVKKPKNYDSSNYDCCCKREESKIFGAITDCDQMLNYARLPKRNDSTNGAKYLLNWPNCGNDYYINWEGLSKKQYLKKLEEAKTFTLGFVYYIQNELGYKNLRLSDEFSTKDKLAHIPYHRESRRVHGEVLLTANYLENPYDYNFYKTGIAVGDYPIDHHHDKNSAAPKIDFIDIKIPSYSIPLGSLIPKDVPNFLVTEKNISVSNIVNGTTRLQPVVLGIGQAVGTLAALSVEKNKNPHEISVREVQNELLNSDAYLMPFIDTKPSDHGFKSMQRIGATGILKGLGIPYKWANQTWFYPEQHVSQHELIKGMQSYYPILQKEAASGERVKLDYLLRVLKLIKPSINQLDLKIHWKSWDVMQAYDNSIALDRRSISIILDKTLNPFEIPINYKGVIVD